VAITAPAICREASASARTAARIHAIVSDGESPAREAVRLAARVELLRRGLQAQGQPVPEALERAIAALLGAARELPREL
jgi:hypothetical protein